MAIECNEISQVSNELLIAFKDCNKVKNEDLRKFVKLVLAANTCATHTHTKSQITDFAHTHPISDVTGLSMALNDLQLNKEDKSNKQNSLDTDATGTKYPTVTAVKNAIDSIYQPDIVIRYTAPTRVGNTFTFPSGGYDVLLSKQFHTNVSQLETTIAAATDGFKRIDLIYYKADDTIAKIQGTESATVAVRPEVPAGGIELCLINVFGATIEVPEVNGAYVQKSEHANVVLTGSGVINQLNLVDEKATIVFKDAITRLNTISYASVPYNGKRITLFNAQATPVTIGNSVSGYGVDFVFADGQDYVLAPNQTIEFSFDITYAPYAHHMPIGWKTDISGKKNKTLAVTTVPGISKTLADTDECIIFTNANPVTLIIPTDTSAPIPIGTEVQYTQQGNGVVTVGGAGITFVTNLALAMVKGETRTLTKIGIDTWTVEGNIPEEARMPYCVFVDFVNGNDSTGKIENKSKPFKNLDSVFSSLPSDNGKSWMIVFLSNATYPCTSFPNRNLEFDSDYLVDIDFTSSALDCVALGVAKFYRFYGGKISLKSQKISFQQFSVVNVSSNGASLEGHLNEIKWECPSSSTSRSLIHIDQFNGVALKINKVNTYSTNIATSVISYSTANGTALDVSLEVLEFTANYSGIYLLRRISTSGNAFANVLIRNITANTDCGVGFVNTITFLKASASGRVSFLSTNMVRFENTQSTANFRFNNVSLVTGNLISSNYNGSNETYSVPILFINFSGKLNDIRHYTSTTCRFVNSSIESNTVLFQNLDTTNLDGRFIFENCILKQVTVGNIITGNASTIHVFGTLKTNQVLTTTLTITNKTPNTY